MHDSVSSETPRKRMPKAGIVSDAQKKAIRKYMSETHPRPSQNACKAWFEAQFNRSLNRATISKILSSKYQHLDNGPAGPSMRVSSSQWPILDKKLFEWYQQRRDAGFWEIGPLIRQKAIEYWRNIPEYKDLPMPDFSDGYLARFKKRHAISLRHRTSNRESASAQSAPAQSASATRSVSIPRGPPRTEESHDDGALRQLLDRYRPDLKPFEAIYRHLHNQPELSGEEEQTAQTAAEHLRSLEFEVQADIGGHGVAGVLHNGDGPTILLRADMDALPLEEKSGLPYASKRYVKDKDGKRRHVAHACGHDSHVTALMAAATLLHAAREHWGGTLICIFQPSEENFNGGRAMLDDGLYEKIPMPDVVLAQHVMRMRAGTVCLKAGSLLTAADSFDVRVFGRGGHGSAPQTTIDPIVIGASIVMRLQSIVSREVTPGELAVVSCGSINAGHGPNIIPDHLDLQLNVRTLDASVRKHVCAAIHRIIEAECSSAGAVEKPKITKTSSAPATVNDEETVNTLRATFQPYFQDRMVDMERPSASEDFSLLATAVGAPYVMWMFGGIDAETWDDAVANDRVNELPSNHSPFFAPAIQPTLQTGVDALALGALTFLKRK